MTIYLKEVDAIELVTLQDNYIDLLSQSDTDIICRAKPLNGNEVTNSILAEHGFSLIITVTAADKNRTVLYDFGFSKDAALQNAQALNVDLSAVEVMALSHGHLDHFGGISTLARHINKKEMAVVLHPAAFKTPRYLKLSEEFKINFPSLTRRELEDSGLRPVETREPHVLLDGLVISSGEIPRSTAYEKGVPYLYCVENGVEKQDPIEDDLALIMSLKGKGLVILTGCAHAGVINTILHAKEITGINQVHAIIGGFHLTGPVFEPIIPVVTDALKEINPRYIVPTHCTGRKAIMHIEKEMPDRFILNMSGTKLLFNAN
ncbi:MAG: MBL fold metallo-hydrolase [Thermodesulfobacteriota bacterium]